MKEKWIYIETVTVMTISYDLYINESKTICKQVWNDGEIEYYEPA